MPDSPAATRDATAVAHLPDGNVLFALINEPHVHLSPAR